MTANMKNCCIHWQWLHSTGWRSFLVIAGVDVQLHIEDGESSHGCIAWGPIQYHVWQSQVENESVYMWANSISHNYYLKNALLKCVAVTGRKRISMWANSISHNYSQECFIEITPDMCSFMND